jgi:hypothetical protein
MYQLRASRHKLTGTPRAIADESDDYRLRALVDEMVRQNASEREITRVLRSMNG